MSIPFCPWGVLKLFATRTFLLMLSRIHIQLAIDLQARTGLKGPTVSNLLSTPFVTGKEVTKQLVFKEMTKQLVFEV
jgi:hypothetical protein